MSKKLSNIKFWSVKAEKTVDGQRSGHLYLYGVISSMSWWGDEVTPKQFSDDIKALGEITELNVHICSDGGDVFAGTAIFSILKQQAVPVNVYIEGVAASIATVIAMAGDNIFISRIGMMYIHNAMISLFGYYNANQMEDIIKDLEKFREPIITAYQSKTSKTREEIISIMDGENNQGSWFTADDAISMGFANAYIPDESDVAVDCIACLAPDVYKLHGVTLDLSQYANVPPLPINTKKVRRKTKMQKSTKKTKKQAKNKVKIKVQAKAKAELVEVTCPECGCIFEADTDQGEVTCPDCDAVFEVETNQDDSDNEEDSVSNELEEVTCSECDAVFETDTDQGDVTCPECGAVFNLDDSQGEPDTSAENKKINKFSAGVASERKRIIALDSIAAAYPDSAKLVAMAKEKGWSFEEASRRAFNIMTTKNAASVAADGDAAQTFLNGFAKDVSNGSKKISAKPNAGNGINRAKGDDANEIANVVDIYNKMRNGGKRNENKA